MYRIFYITPIAEFTYKYYFYQKYTNNRKEIAKISLRLHIWITRAFVLIFGIGLLRDLWPLTASGPMGWLGPLFVLLIWSSFGVYNLCTSAVLACPLCGRSYGPRILFQMRFPHCGGEVPRDAYSPRHIWVPTVLFAALLAGAVFYSAHCPFQT